MSSLLDANIAWNVLSEAKQRGADFADIFVEHHTQSSIAVMSKKVHEIQSGIDFGIGIRLVYGTQVFYGYTNLMDQDELIRITKSLSALNKDKALTNVELPAFNFITPANIHSQQLTLESDYPQEQKVKYLMKISEHALAQSEYIVQTSIKAIERLQKVEIFNTEGLHTQDTRQYCRIASSVIAQKEGESSEGYEGPGSFTGWEMTEQHDPKEIAEKISRRALIKLDAKNCPAGKMPVVIEKGFGGVIFHEACGHLLETTSVAKKASVFHDQMDQLIANPVVNAVDDGTMANFWGSINIDDEGMPTQRTQLIKDGVLTSFLVDKVGSLKTGFAPTGSGRKQNYKYAPASRMRNTFIEPGDSSLEEMIASIDKGIYCKQMGGGSVNPGTGEFNFNAQESYLVEKGKITSPLKSATLIGTGPEILKQISMVGNNFELAAGMCGSISGAVPTTVGQPAIKVDDILVGGQNS